MQSWLEGRICVGKGAQATGMTASLRILSSKADSDTLENFTRSELKLESVHQESPRLESDIFRNQPSHFWNRNIVRSILPGLKRQITGLLPSGPKFSFQMKYILYLIWKSRSQSLEEEWRGTESMFLKSSVKFPQSVMIWAAMSSGPLCFLKSTVNAAIYQDILEHFMLPSADKLYGDDDFIFQQDFTPAHTAKGTKSWFNEHGATVLDWLANSPDLNPIENLWGIVKRKMRDTRPNNADELKATVKETWASYHLSSATNWSPPCHAELRQ